MNVPAAPVVAPPPNTLNLYVVSLLFLYPLPVNPKPILDTVPAADTTAEPTPTTLGWYP